MQLSDFHQELNQLNVDIVAMTYDSHRDALKFVKKNKLPFPVLQDKARLNANKLGILNPQYKVGHFDYGVPYPGIFLVDPQGVIRAKFAEQGYKKRPNIELILEAAKAIQ